MFRHPHIYRMSRHPHGPRATQPSDDLPSTRVSSADANTGQGPHSTGDDPKTGHPNISEDPWWVAGKLSVLTWFRSCRLNSGPSVGLSCFVLFLLGRQPEDWPFTGFLHCQSLCESGSRRLCRTIGAGTPCTDIPSKNLAENLQMLCIRARDISPHMCQLRLHHKERSGMYFIQSSDVRDHIRRDGYDFMVWTSQHGKTSWRTAFQEMRIHPAKSHTTVG